MASSACPACGLQIEHETGQRGYAPTTEALPAKATLERTECSRCAKPLIRALSDQPDAVWHLDHTQD